jgi:spermidine/putrescine transport system ATP-binding protein
VALSLGGVTLPAAGLAPGLPAGADLVAVLRPEDVTLSATAADASIAATVEDVIHVGSHVVVTLRSGDVSLTCRRGGAAVPEYVAIGARVFAAFDPARLHVVAG